MRKSLKFFIVMVICCLMCSTFCACSFFESSTTDGNGNSGSGNSSSSGSNNSGSSTSNTYSVKVVYDDESLNFNFSSTSAISITPRYKTGNVLEGYYTQRGGSGELMIDYLGKCVSANWMQSMPNVVYPYYTSVNYDYVYTSSKTCDEAPEDFHYNINGAKYASWLLNYGQSVYIHKVCVSNPTIKVKYTAYADVRANHATTGKMYLAMANQSGASALREGELKYRDLSLTTSFANFSLSIDMTAATVISSRNKYFGIGFITNGTVISYYTGYVKNIYFTMNFIN